jgi:hypothetical protein
MNSVGRKRSTSVSGRPPGVDASGPSLSRSNQPPQSAQSMGVQHPGSSARSLPVGPTRTSHSGTPISSTSSMHRVVDRHSDTLSTGALPREVTTTPVLVSSPDGGPVAYFRTRSGSRRGPGNSHGNATVSPVQVWAFTKQAFSL